jgi:hypothetical protein
MVSYLVDEEHCASSLRASPNRRNSGAANAARLIRMKNPNAPAAVVMLSW